MPFVEEAISHTDRVGCRAEVGPRTTVAKNPGDS